MGLWWVKNYMFNKPSPKSGESSTPNFINAIGAHQQLQRSAFRCGLREVCAPSCSFIKESQALHAGVTRKKPICNGYHPNMIWATFQSWGWYDVGQNLLWDIEQKKHTDIENQIFQAHDMKKMVNRGNIWWCDHDITKPWTFNTHTHVRSMWWWRRPSAWRCIWGRATCISTRRNNRVGGKDEMTTMTLWH